MGKSKILFGALVGILLLAGCQSTGLTFKVGNEKIYRALAKPEGKGPFPAVVLLHACGGVTGNVSTDWPNYLTKLGYAVLTVDTFGSRGVEKCPSRVKFFHMFSDAYAALDALAKRPDIDGDRVAVFGYSMGGVVVNDIAISSFRNKIPYFKAGISFYGYCSRISGSQDEVRFPLMEIFGDKDTETKDCVGLKENSKFKIVILPDTYHDFDTTEFSGRTNHLGT